MCCCCAIGVVRGAFSSNHTSPHGSYAGPPFHRGRDRWSPLLRGGVVPVGLFLKQFTWVPRQPSTRTTLSFCRRAWKCDGSASHFQASADRRFRRMPAFLGVLTLPRRHQGPRGGSQTQCVPVGLSVSPVVLGRVRTPPSLLGRQPAFTGRKGQTVNGCGHARASRLQASSAE